MFVCFHGNPVENARTRMGAQSMVRLFVYSAILLKWLYVVIILWSTLMVFFFLFYFFYWWGLNQDVSAVSAVRLVYSAELPFCGSLQS